jgi:hypothetical protein
MEERKRKKTYVKNTEKREAGGVRIENIGERERE